MVCGNITGNISNPIRITFYATEPVRESTDIPHPTENQGINNPNITDTCTEVVHSSTVYMASISSLATALILSIVISTTVIAMILKRSKAKIKAVIESSSRAEGTTQMESVYEEVIGPISAIDTHDNIAYSLTETSTATM